MYFLHLSIHEFLTVYECASLASWLSQFVREQTEVEDAVVPETRDTVSETISTSSIILVISGIDCAGLLQELRMR